MRAMRSLAFLVTCVTFSLAGCGDDDAPPANGDGGVDGASGDGGIDSSSECTPATPPESCDYFTGCGCDVAAGQKCSIGPSTRRCATDGSKGEWETCVNDGECMAGTTCVEYPMGGGVLRCLAFCDAGHACTSNESCFITISNDLGSLCGQVCSLLSQDCAYDGLNCHALSGIGAEMGGCVLAGTAAQGDLCGGTTGQRCMEGFNCVTPESATDSLCAKLCDHGHGDADCTAIAGNLTCKTLVGHTTTGICLP
jgi:hypothetical protein